MLKALVLFRGESTAIDIFNTFKHLCDESLYGEKSISLKHLFGAQACCLVSQLDAREQLKVQEFTAEKLVLPAGERPML